MCDPLDVVHAAVNPIDFGLSKIGMGSPVSDLAKKLVDQPAAPKPPALPPAPPPPVDPTDQIIRRAMASERLRSARSGGSAFKSPAIGPAPIAVPKATGY